MSWSITAPHITITSSSEKSPPATKMSFYVFRHWTFVSATANPISSVAVSFVSVTTCLGVPGDLFIRRFLFMRFIIYLFDYLVNYLSVELLMSPHDVF